MANGVEFKRGDIYYADFGVGVGSEQGGIRPVVIVQNNVGNKYSPTLIVAPLTSKLTKTKLPTHVMIRASESGLAKDSIALTEQIRVIDKIRIKEYITSLTGITLARLNEALEISLGLSTEVEKKAEQLTSEIKVLDVLISKCITILNTIKPIEQELKTREHKLYELESYCKNNKLNINNYYTIEDTSSLVPLNSLLLLYQVAL